MKKIWITWEKQRRSIELSKALNAEYCELLEHSSQIKYRPFRYFALSIKTIKLLLRIKPDIVFAQNPSLILAFLLCSVRNIFGYKLVIDRHSNFKFDKNPKEIKWRLFNWLSGYTIKNAQLTIVTNDYLKKFVDSNGGKGFRLEDKLPELNNGERVVLSGQKNIVFICSFSEDEPLFEIVESTKWLNGSWKIYITGNYKNYKKRDVLFKKINKSIVLTGYLNEKNYQSLLNSADLIIVLTKMDHTLTCGAYEAVSVGQPVVASNSLTIKNYFNKGFIYSGHEPRELAESIKAAIYNEDHLRKEVKLLRDELILNWEKQFASLCNIISSF